MKKIQASERRQPPNILVVILDAVRASSLSCYGAPQKTTPFIDTFATTSTLFENAYVTAPWTLPSHASILTGLYPSEHGAHAKHPFLNEELPSLPEILRNAGYKTSLCTYVPFLTRQFGMARGFTNVYQPYQMLSDAPKLRTLLEENKWTRRLTNLGDRAWRWLASKRGDFGARPITKNAIRWISKHPPDTRWFMMINYFDAHLPYWPPRKFRDAFLSPPLSTAALKQVNQNPWAYYSGRAPMDARDFQILESLYHASILYLDHWLERLIGFLQETGRIDNTMVIITSDHGENITEKPVFGHNLYLNEQLLRVPMIIHYPQGFPPGHRISSRVQSLDLFYTILEAAEFSDLQRSTHAVRNISLKEIVEGDDIEMPIFAQYHGMRETPDDQHHKLKYPGVDFQQFDQPAYVAIQGDYKLIHLPGAGGELYNLSLDPEEKKDLYTSRPEVVEKLRKLLQRNFRLQTSAPGGKHDVDKEIERRLADLGYI